MLRPLLCFFFVFRILSCLWNLCLISENFAVTEVSYFDMKLVGNQDVFWLQIPMCYVSFMHELQSTHNLCCVKLSKAGWQSLCHFKQPSETSLLNVLKQEVQIVFVLESGVKLHDVWVPRKCLCVFALSKHGLNFVVFNNVVLLQDLKSILL